MGLDIADVGPTPANFHASEPWKDMRTGSGRILCLAIGANNQRVYAGSYAGVWRSDDVGRTWRQMARPQPGNFDADVPGALHAPHIFDVAVSPGNADIVLAVGVRSQFDPPRNGVYRSADGGASWTLVVPGRAGQVVFAPDDPALVMATLGDRIAISHNAGANWTLHSLNPVWHVAIGPLETGGVRRVYAAGDNTIWRSADGGDHWRMDAGAAVVRNSRAATSAFIVSVAGPTAALPAFATATGDVMAPGAQALAIAPDNPEQVFLATQGGTYGPSYFRIGPNGPVPDGTGCNTTPDRLAGEGSIWFADFAGFDATRTAHWEAVPGPPVYSGDTMPGGYAITPSGKVFVVAKATASGYLLFFADQGSVHVAVGRPMMTAAWHRIGARDASYDARHGEFYDHTMVHHDPHAIVLTADLDLRLKAPPGVSSPYNLNSELDQHLAGTILVANDGGVQWSNDGGESWTPASGLPTLDPINIAGVAGLGPHPALYIGCGDNDCFFSTDGGASWRDPSVHLGDADAWFADIAQATRVLQFAPRGGGLVLFTGGGYPDATGSGRVIPPPASSNASSGQVLRGFSPLVRTLTTEPAPSDGDYVFIGKRSDDVRVLFRTKTISNIGSVAHWENPTRAQQVGPPLPTAMQTSGVQIVQAAGGHFNTAFYISDGKSLWTFDPIAQQWQLLVPGGPSGRSATKARRVFADPFNALLVYILDEDGFRVSFDGGRSWIADTNLTDAMTGGGKLDIALDAIVRDMLFVRSEPFTRFAFGSAGVVCTVDGIEWRALLNSIAMGGCPNPASMTASPTR